MCKFLLFILEFIFLIRGSYFNKKLQLQVTILVIMSQNWMLTFLMDFVNFDKICRVILKKTFLSGVIASVNWRRKDFKVLFLSFGLHARRVYSRMYKKWKHAIFIFWYLYIRFIEFYFGFKDCRVFTVSLYIGL